MTNDLSGGILPIHKCDRCKDGYLIVRKKDNTPPYLVARTINPTRAAATGKLT